MKAAETTQQSVDCTRLPYLALLACERSESVHPGATASMPSCWDALLLLRLLEGSLLDSDLVGEGRNTSPSYGSSSKTPAPTGRVLFRRTGDGSLRSIDGAAVEDTLLGTVEGELLVGSSGAVLAAVPVPPGICSVSAVPALVGTMMMVDVVFIMPVSVGVICTVAVTMGAGVTACAAGAAPAAVPDMGFRGTIFLRRTIFLFFFGDSDASPGGVSKSSRGASPALPGV
jgi:hypothetical protein